MLKSINWLGVVTLLCGLGMCRFAVLSAFVTEKTWPGHLLGWGFGLVMYGAIQIALLPIPNKSAGNSASL